MTNRTKLLLGATAGVLLLCAWAAGNIYYETLPGLVVKHPVTGVTTLTINGTNGNVNSSGTINGWTVDGSGNPSTTGTVKAGKFDGPLRFPRIEVSTNYIIQLSDFYVSCIATVTNTLPQCNTTANGHVVIVKSKSTNAVLVVASPGDFIDAPSTNDALAGYSSRIYVSDGVSNWERN